jgi:hypothetical protein
MLADEHCPECHGIPVILLVNADRLVKRCEECGHKWAEERNKPAISFEGRGGWVRFHGECGPEEGEGAAR